MIHRIVIDTNIYISAIFWGGKPREVVNLGRSEKVLIFTSLEIQTEIDRKKLRTKFGLSDDETAQILLDFSSFTNLITTHEKFSSFSLIKTCSDLSVPVLPAFTSTGIILGPWDRI